MGCNSIKTHNFNVFLVMNTSLIAFWVFLGKNKYFSCKRNQVNIKYLYSYINNGFGSKKKIKQYK